MTIRNFEDVLHSRCIRQRFINNTNNLINGTKNTPRFIREDEITRAIVNCMTRTRINPNVSTQRIIGHSRFDIYDNNNGDIAEAAHNGTFQPSWYGINHIVRVFYNRLAAGYTGDFYGLMYLMDIENLDPKSLFSYNLYNRTKALQIKYKVEELLNKFVGQIQVHEPFHNLQSPTETTIVNYDIYVVKMKLDKKNAVSIYNAFYNDLKFFKTSQFVSLLNRSNQKLSKMLNGSGKI